MTDPKRPHLPDRKDRYVRGELTAAEARELAQESLDNTELFEDLTFSAVAKAALSSESVQKRLRTADARPKVVRFPLKTLVLLASAAAVAAVVFISLYPARAPFLRQNRPSLAQNPAAAPSPKPALAFRAKPGQPLLLASGLLAANREGAQVFRAADPDSRSPESTGSILSIEAGLATIDRGSLDGLTKGSQLQVFRDEHSTQAIGGLVVTTVFRERARGRILAGEKLEAHYQIRVPAALYLDALLQRAEALSSRGDSGAARAMAEKAVGWAQTSKAVPPDARQKALERLAGLEYQVGSYEAAEKHYQSAADSSGAPPATSNAKQATIYNNLGVLHLLRGDNDGAEAALSRAVSKSSKADSIYGQSLNNLAVLAELRGNRQKAESLYNDALRTFAGSADSPGQERRAVETNLARLRSAP
jgi:hypothetical protein